MKNILKGKITTLIFISSLVILMLSLSGCIGGEDNTGSNDYSTNNTPSESSESSGHRAAASTISPMPNHEVEKPQLPTSDKISGEEPIKRYPGSVMLKYSISTTGYGKHISIKYGTDKDPQEVFNVDTLSITCCGYRIF